MNENKVTLSGKEPEGDFPGAPAPIDEKTGMHKDYWVLSEEERAKEFVRPLRLSYVHIGARPKHPLRDLTDDEKERYKDCDYFKFEEYPESESCIVGKFWTKLKLDHGHGCRSHTKMDIKLAETYAREPKFYGSTFCCICSQHFPVEEFVWEGTEELVGS